MFLINDLTVVIVTYKTNNQILEECIESIYGKAKILIVEPKNVVNTGDSTKSELTADNDVWI